MNQCLSLLKAISSKADAAAFLEPVDWERFGLTDYPKIITNPMDLGTVQVRFTLLFACLPYPLCLSFLLSCILP